MVFPTSRPHACRMDRVRGSREKFVDVAVGLVSWTIPILVPAGYSRYQAGTGQLFADPPLVNLMPLSLAVLAAATAARTAGRSRRAGMARSAGIVLGAGVGSVVIGLLAAALLPAAAFYDPEPTIAVGLVVCALAVSGGWALGRLGWAEPGASVPALRRLSQRAWVRLPLVGVAIGLYLAVFAVLLYLGGVNGMVGGWLWSSAVLGGAGLLAWAALRPLPRARRVVTVITVVVGTGIGCVMAASSEMSPDRLASAMERVVPTTWSLEDEERTLNPTASSPAALPLARTWLPATLVRYDARQSRGSACRIPAQNRERDRDERSSRSRNGLRSSPRPSAAEREGLERRELLGRHGRLPLPAAARSGLRPAVG